MRVPGIPYVQGRNSYPDGDGRKFGIAIHNTSNDASDSGEASYATRRTDGVSSHFYADADSVTQSLDTDARAGHAGSRNGNENAIAFEITGANGWTRQQWLDRVAWDKVAEVAAVLCREYGIEPRRATVAEMQANPKVRAFYGHDDMRRAWGGTTHTDPGPNFPWDHLLGKVEAALTGETTEDDDMAMSAEDRAELVRDIAAAVVNQKLGRSGPSLGTAVQSTYGTVAKLAGGDLVDEDAIVAGVLAGLGSRSPADVAAALVAAGIDPAQLAAALTQLSQGQARG